MKFYWVLEWHKLIFEGHDNKLIDLFELDNCIPDENSAKVDMMLSIITGIKIKK